MADTQMCVAAATLATLPFRMKKCALLPIAYKRFFFFCIYWLSQFLQKTISTNTEILVVRSR